MCNSPSTREAKAGEAQVQCHPVLKQKQNPKNTMCESFLRRNAGVSLYDLGQAKLFRNDIRSTSDE
jgi:hypothetical protein